jgi:L-iditol 2-dehydrogenase
MLEPVNTVLKGIRRLGVLRGDTVLVVGLGPIGLMFTRLLVLEGVRVIGSDLVPWRLKMGLAFGASRVVRGDDLELLTRVCGGHRQRAVVDSAVITARCDRCVLHALEAVRGGGRVLLFAHTHDGPELPVELASICRDEKDLIGSYSSDFTLQRDVSRLVFERRLDVRSLITHRFPLERTGAAVELSGTPQEGVLKVMISQLGEAGVRHGRVSLRR